MIKKEIEKGSSRYNVAVYPWIDGDGELAFDVIVRDINDKMECRFTLPERPTMKKLKELVELTEKSIQFYLKQKEVKQNGKGKKN